MLREKFPLQKPRWEKQYDNQVLLLREHIVSLVSSYFPISGQSITQTSQRYENVYIRCKQHKNSTPKTQQRNRLGTISHIKLQNRGLEIVLKNHPCLLTLIVYFDIMHQLVFFFCSGFQLFGAHRRAPY